MPILPHTYGHPASDPAAYEADLLGLQAISLSFAFGNLWNMDVWIWSDDNDGNARWALVEELDGGMPEYDDQVQICLPSGKRAILPPDYRVFVSKADITKLGFVIPPAVVHNAINPLQ